MPQPYVAGPCHFFPFIGAGRTPTYFGTTENTPDLEVRPAHTPYFNSLNGTKVPMDWCDQGAEHYLVGDFNRFSWTQYLVMASRPNAGGVFGIQAEGDMGTMVIFERLSYSLAIQFPYAAKAAMGSASAPGGPMPPGFLYLNARLVGPDRITPNNMEPLKIRMVWHILPTVVPGIGNMVRSGLIDPAFNFASLPSIT